MAVDPIPLLRPWKVAYNDKPLLDIPLFRYQA